MRRSADPRICSISWQTGPSPSLQPGKRSGRASPSCDLRADGGAHRGAVWLWRLWLSLPLGLMGRLAFHPLHPRAHPRHPLPHPLHPSSHPRISPQDPPAPRRAPRVLSRNRRRPARNRRLSRRHPRVLPWMSRVASPNPRMTTRVSRVRSRVPRVFSRETARLSPWSRRTRRAPRGWPRVPGRMFRDAFSPGSSPACLPSPRPDPGTRRRVCSQSKRRRCLRPEQDRQ